MREMIAEIIGPSGKVHYRRPADDPLVAEARKTLGYSVRFVERDAIESALAKRARKNAARMKQHKDDSHG